MFVSRFRDSLLRVCLQRLLINDPKKCCGDDVIQPQLILACGDVLKRCGSAKFDSSTDIDAVDAVAALVIDVCTFNAFPATFVVS